MGLLKQGHDALCDSWKAKGLNGLLCTHLSLFRQLPAWPRAFAMLPEAMSLDQMAVIVEYELLLAEKARGSLCMELDSIAPW